MVLPSIEEGLAIVQGQALACGCPVIASSATGAADLFVDGEQGIILDDCTPETIEAAIMRLYSDRALWRRMSIAAASLVDTLGGWADYGEKLSNRFLRLTKGGSRR
jgi:glycosyltransferase involved in cell wall biosynthesis